MPATRIRPSGTIATATAASVPPKFLAMMPVEGWGPNVVSSAPLASRRAIAQSLPVPPTMTIRPSAWIATLWAAPPFGLENSSVRTPLSPKVPSSVPLVL